MSNTPEPTVSDPYVFLGGSCATTTWRQDVAIPILDKVGVTYFDPQTPMGTWHEGMIAIENDAKDKSTALLFVVASQSRTIATMIEMVEAVCTGRWVYLVLEDMAADARIDGCAIDPQQLKDLRAARRYMADVVDRQRARGRLAQVYADVETAVRAIVEDAACYGRAAARVIALALGSPLNPSEPGHA